MTTRAPSSRKLSVITTYATYSTMTTTPVRRGRHRGLLPNSDTFLNFNFSAPSTPTTIATHGHEMAIVTPGQTTYQFPAPPVSSAYARSPIPVDSPAQAWWPSSNPSSNPMNHNNNNNNINNNISSTPQYRNTTLIVPSASTSSKGSTGSRSSGKGSSTILLLDRSAFQDPPDSPSESGELRRRPHIRRPHRRGASASNPRFMSMEMDLDVDAETPVDRYFNGPASAGGAILTPLYDSFARKLSLRSQRATPSPTVASPSSVYPASNHGSWPQEDPEVEALRAFMEGRISQFHDWEMGIHMRNTAEPPPPPQLQSEFLLPSPLTPKSSLDDEEATPIRPSRRVPQRAPTYEVRDLLQARLRQAGYLVNARQESFSEDPWHNV